MRIVALFWIIPSDHLYQQTYFSNQQHYLNLHNQVDPEDNQEDLEDNQEDPPTDAPESDDGSDVVYVNAWTTSDVIVVSD